LHTLPHWTLGVAKVLLTFSALVGIGLLVYWRISPFFRLNFQVCILKLRLTIG